MGLEIVATHPELGLIEATATTFWFGFKDDVAIRVQEYPQGVIIDVRSVSRVGQSDLGVNARRIGEILNNISGS
jgi:fatty-acyl-CoA synthase